MSFTVTNPVDQDGVTFYTVNGQDSQGSFEVKRRYNEFEVFRSALVERWPGCYVPYIPEKAGMTQDNKGGNFIEERRALLARFIREIAQFEFILNSEEFKIFARTNGEIKRQIEGLSKQRPKEILEKFRATFKIDEDQASSEMARYKEKINIFQMFIRKSIISLEVSNFLSVSFLIGF